MHFKYISWKILVTQKFENLWLWNLVKASTFPVSNTLKILNAVFPFLYFVKHCLTKMFVTRNKENPSWYSGMPAIPHMSTQLSLVVKWSDILIPDSALDKSADVCIPRGPVDAK